MQLNPDFERGFPRSKLGLSCSPIVSVVDEALAGGVDAGRDCGLQTRNDQLFLPCERPIILTRIVVALNSWYWGVLGFVFLPSVLVCLACFTAKIKDSRVLTLIRDDQACLRTRTRRRGAGVAHLSRRCNVISLKNVR